MNGQHTPGPWKLDSEPSFHRNRVWTQDMHPIAGLCSMGSAPADIDPEAQANARLIAAAPELLASLSDVLSYLHDDIRGISMFTGLGCSRWHDVLRKATAAIAKATGESTSLADQQARGRE